jgi:hypothetical protein
LLNCQLKENIRDLTQIFELETNNTTTTTTTTTITSTAGEKGRKKGRSDSQAVAVKQGKVLGKVLKV